MQANMKFKDSLFTGIFGYSKERIADLYYAVSAKKVPPEKIEVVTLHDYAYKGRKNDIAFIADGKLVMFIESQSSWNPNMPVRDLRYCGEVYILLANKLGDIYGAKLIPLPPPEFYLFFSGSESEWGKAVCEARDMDKIDSDKKRFVNNDTINLRLSDAFSANSVGQMGYALELVVEAINIGIGHAADILDRYPLLKGFSIFNQVVQQEKIQEPYPDGYESMNTEGRAAARQQMLNNIMSRSVIRCGRQGLLAGTGLLEFLELHEWEVLGMLIADYDPDLAEERAAERAAIRAKIEAVVNIIKELQVSLSKAMMILKLDPEYRVQIISELRSQDIAFTE